MLQEQLVFTENYEDGSDVAEVLCPGCAVDQYVVEEDEHELAQERPQHIIHQRLECSRRVGESERHDEELIQIIMCSEGRLGDVCRIHADLVIAGAEIETNKQTNNNIVFCPKRVGVG